MVGKLFDVLRDAILLCTLIALVQIALESNISFILEHKQSMTHELDRDFIDQLYTAQRHIHLLESSPEYSPALEDTITDIKNRLTRIEEQYKKNSPSLALLGPIGSSAIVIKEAQLKKKLLALINDISGILHTINNTSEPFEPALTVDSGLSINHNQLKRIITT